MKRRCLSAQQCYNLTRKANSQSGSWMLYKPENRELPWECVDECPNGYLPNSDDTECVKCNKSCPKGEKGEFALYLNFADLSNIKYKK